MTGYRDVVVAVGHMTDQPGRPRARFPESAASHVSRAVLDVLTEWRVGPGWLLLCGGARGADLIAAEHALALGADVELHLAEQSGEYVVTSVGPAWRSRFDDVQRRSKIHGVDVDVGGGDRYVRTNESLLARARDVADGGDIHAIAVWDGQPGDGPGGTADMVAALDALLDGRGVLRIIDPRETDHHMGGVAS